MSFAQPSALVWGFRLVAFCVPRERFVGEGRLLWGSVFLQLCRAFVRFSHLFDVRESIRSNGKPACEWDDACVLSFWPSVPQIRAYTIPPPTHPYTHTHTLIPSAWASATHSCKSSHSMLLSFHYLSQLSRTHCCMSVCLCVLKVSLILTLECVCWFGSPHIWFVENPCFCCFF